MNEKQRYFNKTASRNNDGKAIRSELLMTLEYLETQARKIRHVDSVIKVQLYKRQLVSGVPAKKILRKLEAKVYELQNTVLNMQTSNCR